MNYIFKIKLPLLFAIFLTYCNVSIAATECDPRALRLIPDLDYYWSEMVKVGDKLKLSCKRPYGVLVQEGRYDSSFEVTCGSDGKFTGQKSCQLACDMSHVLKASHKYDLPETLNKTTGFKVSASKLVANGDKIAIKCLPYYNIPTLSVGSNVTSYEYQCGYNNTVHPCRSQDVVFDKKPPKSNIASDFKPSYSCNLNQLIIANATITTVSRNADPVSSTVKPGGSVEITCKTGYAAHDGIAPDSLGPKLNRKFTAICDPAGTGKFLNTKACVQKCNVTSLIKASNGKESNATLSTALLYNQNNLINSLGSVAMKNFDTSPQYMDIGQAVKIQCAPGYEIRKTSKDHYFSSCSSVGFSDVEVCETVIPPCQNSELQIEGILQQNGFERNGTTAVGTQVKARCQGGDAYFLDPQNKGIPRCIYDEKTQTSSWNIKNFNCYNGCIKAQTSSSALEKVPTDKTLVTYSSDILDYRTSTNCSNVTSYYGFEGLNNKYVTPTCGWTPSRYTPQEIDNLINNRSGSYHVGFIVIKNFVLEKCLSRQTELKKIATFARKIFQTSYISDVNTYHLYYDRVSGCSEFSATANGTVCKNSLSTQNEANGKKIINLLSDSNICQNVNNALKADNTFKMNDVNNNNTNCYGNATSFTGGGNVCSSALRFRKVWTSSMESCLAIDGSSFTKY
jgi:hypothetical protein